MYCTYVCTIYGKQQRHRQPAAWQGHPADVLQATSHPRPTNGASHLVSFAWSSKGVPAARLVASLLPMPLVQNQTSAPSDMHFAAFQCIDCTVQYNKPLHFRHVGSSTRITTPHGALWLFTSVCARPFTSTRPKISKHMTVMPIFFLLTFLLQLHVVKELS